MAARATLIAESDDSISLILADARGLPRVLGFCFACLFMLAAVSVGETEVYIFASLMLPLSTLLLRDLGAPRMTVTLTADGYFIFRRNRKVAAQGPQRDLKVALSLVLTGEPFLHVEANSDLVETWITGDSLPEVARFYAHLCRGRQ